MNAAKGEDTPYTLAPSARAGSEGGGYFFEELAHLFVVIGDSVLRVREERLPDEVAEGGGDDVFDVAHSEEVSNGRWLDWGCGKDGTEFV